MVDEQDRMLPIANVGRIMKQTLPPTAKISKEAKQTMQECSTEFISFVTGEASAKCQKENRKTVNGDDICWALSSLGFDDYARAMMRYVQRYREHERDKPSAPSASVAANQPSISNDQGHSSATQRSSDEPFLGINWACSTSSHQQEDDRDRSAEADPLNSKAVHTLEFRIINERN